MSHNELFMQSLYSSIFFAGSRYLDVDKNIDYFGCIERLQIEFFILLTRGFEISKFPSSCSNYLKKTYL